MGVRYNECKWIGTAPFCSWDYLCEPGWIDVFWDQQGDGKPCTGSGFKALCCRESSIEKGKNFNV